jgi:hypothetical protein
MIARYHQITIEAVDALAQTGQDVMDPHPRLDLFKHLFATVSHLAPSAKNGS